MRRFARLARGSAGRNAHALDDIRQPSGVGRQTWVLTLVPSDRVEPELMSCREDPCELRIPDGGGLSCNAGLRGKECCAVWIRVLAIADRVQRKVPRRLDLNVLVALVLDVLARLPMGASLPASPAVLYNKMRHLVVDALRAQWGRRRCSACVHFLRGFCGLATANDRRQHPHFRQQITGRQNPRKLNPPCHQFRDRSRTEPLPEVGLAAPVDEPTGPASRAHARLFEEDALLGGIFMEFASDEGATQAELAKRLGKSRDQIKRLLEKAKHRLRELYEEERRQ
ncbi:MAG: hypothetical protein KDC87_01455 [Planctomycetes bacterium]|nr:hypothetical protein [Planctomycetota bacterium]MCB9870963.1 hypothetical protein [Planctomycetota bacterium]